MFIICAGADFFKGVLSLSPEPRENDLPETLSRLTSLNLNLTYCKNERMKSQNARKETSPMRKHRMLVSLAMAGILLFVVAAAKAEEGPIYPIGEITIDTSRNHKVIFDAAGFSLRLHRLKTCATI
jgi:hypothetical protein